MPANRWMRSRAAAVTIALVLMVSVGASIFAPTVAGAAAAELVKYYEVTASYEGKPENLSEVAQRFLGSPTRSNQIFDLNFGRTQPDGGKLTDANVLHAGWFLVLPWDAVGDGVRYGELPMNPPDKPVTPPRPAAPWPAARPDRSLPPSHLRWPRAPLRRRRQNNARATSTRIRTPSHGHNGGSPHNRLGAMAAATG